MRRLFLWACAPLFVLLLACDDQGDIQDNGAAQISKEDVRLAAFFESSFSDELDLSPEWQTELGIYENNDKWDEVTPEAERAAYELAVRDLGALGDFDIGALSPTSQVSYKVFEYRARQRIEKYKWRNYQYASTQFGGVHTGIPSFLINNHTISNLKNAQDYVTRLEGAGVRMDQSIEKIRSRAEKGFVPPAFAFPQMIEAAGNVVAGYPFDAEAPDAPIYADLKTKLEQAEIGAPDREELLAAARAALTDIVKPAYQRFIDLMTDLGAATRDNNGVWSLDETGAYYQYLLNYYTNTDMSADQIHDLGLKEVARIHGEMETIKSRVGFEGTLQQFFEFMRSDDQFYYPNTDDGRAAYLEEARAIIERMDARLDDIFAVKPKAELVVRRVEPFRERAGGKAFYMSAAPDGSRPGVYYANLMDMTQMPKYQMEALAFHEGIPGHHMQIAIANELEEMPRFRRYTGYTAYIEGWGLYSEYLPKEMGFYEDPYSDFGRLAMELWRACRLVVDTGLHHKRWSKEQAIAYLFDNTPNPEDDVVKAIERYLVFPGQATAYKIGMLKILELREQARQSLGEDFDIREFHDVILRSGSVPLPLLEELVGAYIAKRQSS